jgi:hypothetical protein
MSSIREEYFRCGSCRAYEIAFTDRNGRTMGQCDRNLRYGTVPAHDYACVDYRLDRDRLVPGAKVPDDADSSPRERERRRALEGATERMTRARPAPTQRATAYEAPERPKLREIPLSFEGEDAMDRQELKSILAEVLDEALGVSEAPIQRRYRGGKVIIQPSDPDLAAKELEIDVLFRKITSVREKLRVLEQKVNNVEGLEQEERAAIQGYITSCYGSLKSFNFLFAEREDWFQS